MQQNEDVLIESCQNGRLVDFEELYVRYLKGIYAFIFYRTMDRSTAEDLTSLTFLKALEHIGSYDRNKGAFSTWLYRIARNTVHDHFRTKREHRDIETVWDLPSEDNPFLSAQQSIDFRDIHAALQTMDKQKREILLLRLWDNLSYAEIARITGKSEAACKMTLSRTLDDLRSTLSPSALLLLTFFFLSKLL
jgi:RNA polymerase sigma-70 factor (ECF subfamily)